MEYSKDNTMTRKEYLKSKKKNKFNFSSLKYALLVIVVTLLGIYVFKQLKIYNNVTQMTNKVLEESKLTKTMTMYYVSKSYTKDGQDKLMLYKSSDESRTAISNTEGMHKIHIKEDKLFGLKEDGLYSIGLLDFKLEKIIDQKIEEYIITDSVIYIRKKDGIYKYNRVTKETTKIIDGTCYQMTLDNKDLYVITSGKTSKSIVKYNLNGTKKEQLSGTYIVSYMYISNDYIYFINSKDSKVYSISKSGGEIKKIINNEVKNNGLVEYKGNIYYINKSDGNTLYHINLNLNTEERVIKKNIESIQINNDIIYFNIANDIEIYKYGINTGKISKITSARTEEYICVN